MNLFITGANRGIGYAQTKTFLEDGDSVFATYRDEEKSKDLFLLKEIYNERLHLIKGDITKSCDIDNFFHYVIKSVKSIDILINNAGIDYEAHNPGLEEINTELLMKTYEINTVSMVSVTQALLPLLRSSKRGAIVLNTSSGIGSMSNTIKLTRYAYMMSKVAINMFTRIMAHEFKDDGITTISWSPGWVKTRLGTESAPLTLEEAGYLNVKTIKSLNSTHNGKWIDVSGDEWSY